MYTRNVSYTADLPSAAVESIEHRSRVWEIGSVSQWKQTNKLIKLVLVVAS